jgi:hypothetical protein
MLYLIILNTDSVKAYQTHLPGSNPPLRTKMLYNEIKYQSARRLVLVDNSIIG